MRSQRHGNQESLRPLTFLIAIVFIGLSHEYGIALSRTTEEKEFEWYFRDHLFRSMNKGIDRFEVNIIPRTMLDTYLRYRNANIDEISIVLHLVVENLVTRNVLKGTGDFVELAGNIFRKRCGKCFYVCYVSENEPLSCFRCFSNNLNDFQNKNSTSTNTKLGKSPDAGRSVDSH